MLKKQELRGEKNDSKIFTSCLKARKKLCQKEKDRTTMTTKDTEREADASLCHLQLEMISLLIMQRNYERCNSNWIYSAPKSLYSVERLMN